MNTLFLKHLRLTGTVDIFTGPLRIPQSILIQIICVWVCVWERERERENKTQTVTDVLADCTSANI